MEKQTIWIIMGVLLLCIFSIVTSSIYYIYTQWSAPPSTVLPPFPNTIPTIYTPVPNTSTVIPSVISPPITNVRTNNIKSGTPNDSIIQGQSIVSTNGRYSVVMEANGYLSLIDNQVGSIWNSGPPPQSINPPYRFVMQADGNAVLYDGLNKPGFNTLNTNIGVTHSTAAGTVPPYSLIIQDDGNLVVYDNNSKPLWSRI